MTRPVRVKNAQLSADEYDGQTIEPGDYYTLDSDDIRQWPYITKVFQHVGDSRLIVNNGADNVDDFLDPLEGWKWLSGELEPPRSADGDWHMVNENFAHVVGNEGINWTIIKELESGESYSEMLVLPNNRHATINMLIGGSDQVASNVTLDWYEEISPGTYMRTNPWIRKDELVVARVDGAHTSGDTILNLKNTNNEMDHLNQNYYYCFSDGVTEFHGKITSIDLGAETITLSQGIPGNILDNASLTLTDRPIGNVGNQIGHGQLTWVSPPNSFIGNQKNYFKLTLQNDDMVDVAIISATVNGWHTDVNSGD